MTQSVKSTISQRLKEFQLRPNQKLGQHFLVDDQVLNLIASQADPNNQVIEIGPGVGQLTELLAQRSKKVVAIEIDRRFEKILKLIQKDHRNLNVIFGDALKVDLQQIINQATKKKISTQVIANLPYHITEPFIHRMSTLPLQSLTLLVGKRFSNSAQATNPSNSNFSYLSLLISAYYKVEHIIDVPKSSFVPEPKTLSSLIILTPKDDAIESNDQQRYVSQQLFTTEPSGKLVKNVLIESLIAFGKQSVETNIEVVTTKNQARSAISKLEIPDGILKKPFSHLNNPEIVILAKSLQKISL